MRGPAHAPASAPMLATTPTPPPPSCGSTATTGHPIALSSAQHRLLAQFRAFILAAFSTANLSVQNQDQSLLRSILWSYSEIVNSVLAKPENIISKINNISQPSQVTMKSSLSVFCGLVWSYLEIAERGIVLQRFWRREMPRESQLYHRRHSHANAAMPTSQIGADPYLATSCLEEMYRSIHSRISNAFVLLLH